MRFRHAVVGDAAAAGMEVDPAFPRALPPDAVDAVGDVAQPRAPRRSPCVVQLIPSVRG